MSTINLSTAFSPSLTPKVTPKTWQELARLTHLFGGARKDGSEALQKQCADQVRRYVETHFVPQAPALLQYLGF